ncbi:HD family phosphohydrolase [Bacillus thuringiensis]|uniref:HD family phosphohydrolase n=1 Tax=Bacillus thuringiensis TaxID=1428 RepID=A0A9X6THT8_BACTU|nr:HD family phosphohydrolase [Bacillus thuringiensis]
MLFLKKEICNLKSTKIFLNIFYLILLVHNFYDYASLKNKITLNVNIFEVTFVLLSCLCFLINGYLAKKKMENFSKYLFLIIYTLYMLIHDIFLIHNMDSYIISPYIEFIIIIISPLFLSKPFLATISISILIRYFIVIFIFEIKYLDELVVSLILAIIASYFILSNLIILMKQITLSYKKQMKETMLLVMEALELKDSYTKGHSERVANYAKILAKETGKYGEKDLNMFYFACLLHDVGKIGISDEILNKDSKLTNEEYDIIKGHTLLGIKVVKNLSLSEENESIIRSHHEKWDGSGYPDGLKKEQIPLGARIVSIADAFDAMTSTRSYRNALSPEEAHKRIIKGAGTQFDPHLIENFKRVYPMWIKIMGN